MKPPTQRGHFPWRWSAPGLLYLAIVIGFSIAAPAFPSIENALNILVQMTPVAIGSLGMTFVLLTAGIDLSVGAVMFLTAAVGGALVVSSGWPVAAAVPIMLLAGAAAGCANGCLVTRLGASAFIVTLATMFVARGAGLWITQTRAINLPDAFRGLATGRLGGVPLPVLVLILAFVSAHILLTRTPFGRRLYAIGYSRDAAQTAGLPVGRTICLAYVISGICAALAGTVQVSQLAAVSPNLGQGIELEMIAAAVLGGTSLFGGRGTAAGAILGAAFVQTVRNGLNLIDADPFIYPIVSGVIILLAVLIDSWQQRRESPRRTHMSAA